MKLPRLDTEYVNEEINPAAATTIVNPQGSRVKGKGSREIGGARAFLENLLYLSRCLRILRSWDLEILNMIKE